MMPRPSPRRAAQLRGVGRCQVPAAAAAVRSALGGGGWPQPPRVTPCVPRTASAAGALSHKAAARARNSTHSAPRDSQEGVSWCQLVPVGVSWCQLVPVGVSWGLSGALRVCAWCACVRAGVQVRRPGGGARDRRRRRHSRWRGCWPCRRPLAQQQALASAAGALRGLGAGVRRVDPDVGGTPPLAATGSGSVGARFQRWVALGLSCVRS
jgi:hypothetical protein